MNLHLAKQDEQAYGAGIVGEPLLHTEDDVRDVIGWCFEHDVARLLLDGANLPAEFFELRSGIAGNFLQKFRTYHIKVAAVVSPATVGQGRFAEMVAEENRGDYFRFFTDRNVAAAWLCHDESNQAPNPASPST